MKLTLIGYLLLAILLWGIAPIFDKFGVKSVDVYTGIFYKNFVATTFFGIFYLIYFGIERLWNCDFVGVGWYILSGICASVLGMIFYFNALKLADASLVVPIVATYPLISTILSVIFLKEHLSIDRIIGVIFIILGIWLIIRK